MTNDGRILLNILHVVAGVQPEAAGLAEAVPRLAIEATRLGHQVTIATVARPADAVSEAAGDAIAQGVRIARFRPAAPRSLFFSWEMLRDLPALARAADVVHVHSSWTFPVRWGARCARAAGKPLVISPRGSLDPVRLAHSASKKRLAGLLDRRSLQRATVIHATSETEREWIKRYLGGNPRIEVIPNGVELPLTDVQRTRGSRERRVLYLGRLHPLKGLDLLLDTWRLVNDEVPDAQRWRLVIAGPDEQGTQAKLDRQALTLGLVNVTFAGPLYGDDKAHAMSDADLFVLPSRSENFGSAVAEALAARMPVITTKGTPWNEIEGSCGWWVDVAVNPLAHAIAEAMRLSDEERSAMGARGRALVEAKYQWPSVGRAMVELYEGLVTAMTG